MAIERGGRGSGERGSACPGRSLRPGRSRLVPASDAGRALPAEARRYSVILGSPDERSEQTYFQKGFNLKDVVGPVLAQSYHSQVVDRLKELGYAARAGDVKVKLAREFGFCYGVDRAVEYAYEAREKFPDRRIFLSGEIIHNPEVNGRIEALGIRILPDHRSPEERYAAVEARPTSSSCPPSACRWGSSSTCATKGCVLVDTTCGSVLNVWKNVHRYARDGFTSVIHGKHYHEETKATASQALTHPGGQYLCVKDRPEAQLVCDFIRGTARRGARRALPRGDQPRLRPRARPAEDRPRQPDHHADDREPGDPGDAARRRCATAGAKRRSPSASARSTRSAPPPRTARTRC